MFCLFNETCDIVTANISCVFIHFFYLDFILRLFWHSISIAVVLCLSFTIDQALQQRPIMMLQQQHVVIKI